MLVNLFTCVFISGTSWRMEKLEGWWAGRSLDCCIMPERSTTMSTVNCSISFLLWDNTYLQTADSSITAGVFLSLRFPRQEQWLAEQEPERGEDNEKWRGRASPQPLKTTLPPAVAWGKRKDWGRWGGGRGGHAMLTCGFVVWSLFRSCASQTTRS